MRIKTKIPFEVFEALKVVGQNLRTARVRRALTQDELAAKCQIARNTLASMERGDSGVALGAVFSVLWTLGLLGSVKGLADPDLDEHGKILQAARQVQRVRSPVMLDNDF